MEGILGKAFSVVGIHLVGFVMFYALWYLILIPLFSLPAMVLRDIATIYLIIDVLFFILAKFDN